MQPTYENPFGPAAFGPANLPGSLAGITEEELRKAISAGLPVHGAGSGDLDAIMPEDLSPLLTSLMFEKKNIRFVRLGDNLPLPANKVGQKPFSIDQIFRTSQAQRINFHKIYGAGIDTGPCVGAPFVAPAG